MTIGYVLSFKQTVKVVRNDFYSCIGILPIEYNLRLCDNIWVFFYTFFMMVLYNDFWVLLNDVFSSEDPVQLILTENMNEETTEDIYCLFSLILYNSVFNNQANNTFLDQTVFVSTLYKNIVQ